jgi:hypothetical protein
MFLFENPRRVTNKWIYEANQNICKRQMSLSCKLYTYDFRPRALHNWQLRTHRWEKQQMQKMLVEKGVNAIIE